MMHGNVLGRDEEIWGELMVKKKKKVWQFASLLFREVTSKYHRTLLLTYFKKHLYVRLLIWATASLIWGWETQWWVNCLIIIKTETSNTIWEHQNIFSLVIFFGKTILMIMTILSAHIVICFRVKKIFITWS